MKNHREEELKLIATSIRRYTRKNGFAIRAYGPGRSRALESHILFDIEACGKSIPGSLKALLGIPGSSITRVLLQLEQEGLLHCVIPDHDKRKKEYTLSESGENYVKQLHQRLNTGVLPFLEHLQAHQREQFLMYMGKFFAKKASRHPISNSASPLMKDIYRITRELELLNRNRFAEFGLSTLAWHILCEVQEQQYPISPGDVCSRYRVPPNTLSSALKQLDSPGYLLRTQSSSDKRKQLLSVTTKGETLLAEIQSYQCTLLESGLSGFTIEDLTQFRNLLHVFVDGTTEARLEEEVRIKVLSTQEEYTRARQFLFEWLYQQQSATPLPPCLLDSKNHCYGLFYNGELSGVIECEAIHDRVILHTVACLASLEASEEHRFLLKVLKVLEQHYSQASLAIPEHLVSRYHLKNSKSEHSFKNVAAMLEQPYTS